MPPLSEKEEKSVILENGMIQEKSTFKISWWDIKYQVFTSNIAFIFSINAGVNMTFSNLVLDEFDRITCSWFASIGALSSPVGSFFGGILMQKIGRKGAIVATYAPCIFSWMILAFCNKNRIALLYFSRFLTGLAAGLAVSSAVVYVSETTHKKYRSLFLSLLGIYFSFGILLTTILKAIFTWNQSAIFFAIFFTIAELLVIFLPESPSWLASHQFNSDKAKKSLKRLNPKIEMFETELKHLKENIQLTDKRTNKKTQWTEATVFKPFVSLIVLFALQQLSGLYAMIYYAVTIFPLVSPKIGEIMKTEAFITFGILRFLTSIILSFLSMKIGRRTLLIFSSIGMFLTSFILLIFKWIPTSTCLIFEEIREWSSLILFISFICSGTLGVMTIPWTLAAELLPMQKRATGEAFLSSFSSLTLFFFIKMFPFIIDNFEIINLFELFALISLFLIFFIYVFIPETKDRTLFEIENGYKS